jgi:hypothetical protein
VNLARTGADDRIRGRLQSDPNDDLAKGGSGDDKRYPVTSCRGPRPESTHSRERP